MAKLTPWQRMLARKKPKTPMNPTIKPPTLAKPGTSPWGQRMAKNAFRIKRDTPIASKSLTIKKKPTAKPASPKKPSPSKKPKPEKKPKMAKVKKEKKDYKNSEPCAVDLDKGPIFKPKGCTTKKGIKVNGKLVGPGFGKSAKAKSAPYTGNKTLQQRYDAAQTKGGKIDFTAKEWEEFKKQKEAEQGGVSGQERALKGIINKYDKVLMDAGLHSDISLPKIDESLFAANRALGRSGGPPNKAPAPKKRRLAPMAM